VRLAFIAGCGVLLASCAQGPVQATAPVIQADALTAESIAIDTGPLTDVACYKTVGRLAGDVGPGHTVGVLTLVALRRAIQQHGPCTDVYLQVYVDVARLVSQFH
jgi:hypothetical protein